jgi:radical SAM superfamily enzyme YgiQ (UPF0313 family)
MKIQLISTSFRNLGLRGISSVLKRAGHQVETLFLPDRPGDADLDVIIEFIKEKAPKLIGISLMSPYFLLARKMTERLKSALPETFIVWGGIHPTIFPDECISCTDAICIGEGEMPILELANLMENGENFIDVRNLWFKNGGNIIRNRNATRPFFQPLDALPIPDWGLNQDFVLENARILTITEEIFRRYMPLNGTSYNIVATRGCPYSCTYCSNSALRKVATGKYVRKRTPDHVIEELIHARKIFPYMATVNFQDDCFLSLGDKWIDEFTPLYKKEINMPFLVRIIPNFATEDNILKLVDVGMKFVGMGLQSGSKRIITDIFKRKSLPEDFLRAAKILEKFPIGRIFDVIINNPYESEEDICDTLRVLANLKKPFQINTFYLTAFPGTAFFEKAAQDGVLDKMGDPYHDSNADAVGAAFFDNPCKAHLYNLVTLSNFLPGLLTIYLSRFQNMAALKISTRMLVVRERVLGIILRYKNTNPSFFYKIIRILQRL